MKREDKISLVENLSKKFDENNIFYIMDASGLTVSQVNQFREKCFKKDIEYNVVKNSFIKKALENNENDYSPLINKDVLSGFSGILFSKLSPSEPAKILKDFRRFYQASWDRVVDMSVKWFEINSQTHGSPNKIFHRLFTSKCYSLFIGVYKNTT